MKKDEFKKFIGHKVTIKYESQWLHALMDGTLDENDVDDYGWLTFTTGNGEELVLRQKYVVSINFMGEF